jgi:hypothetical protein
MRDMLEKLIVSGRDRLSFPDTLGKGNDVLGSYMGECLSKKRVRDPLIEFLDSCSAEQVLNFVKTGVLTPDVPIYVYSEIRHLVYGWSEGKMAYNPALMVLRKDPTFLLEMLDLYKSVPKLLDFSDLDCLQKIKSSDDFYAVINIVFEDIDNMRLLANYFYIEKGYAYSRIAENLSRNLKEQLVGFYPTSVKYLEHLTTAPMKLMEPNSYLFEKCANSWCSTTENVYEKMAALIFITTKGCNISIKKMPGKCGGADYNKGMTAFIAAYLEKHDNGGK